MSILRRPRFYVSKVPLGLDLASKQAGGLLLIVIDEDLRDTTLITPEGSVITLHVRGRRSTEEELRELLKAASGATLIGEHAVGIAMEMGLVHPDAIVYLRDESGRQIPYAVYMIM